MRKAALLLYFVYSAVLFVLTVPPATLVVALLAIPGNPAARRRIWRFLYGWAVFYLFFTGRWVRKMNAPSIPANEACVVVLNHQSYLDSLTIFPAVPGFFRPLGKKEIGKIPLFGFIYRQITLLVDRSSAHSRALSMKLMVRSLRKEGHVAIFPEGTFNEAPNEEMMIRFYNGAFRLAIGAQSPILPILMPDTADRWHGVKFWKMSPGRNRVFYLPPIETTGLTQKDLGMLRDKVREIMAEKMRELKA